jgi:hypothetical protein
MTSQVSQLGIGNRFGHRLRAYIVDEGRFDHSTACVRERQDYHVNHRRLGSTLSPLYIVIWRVPLNHS